MRCGSSGAEHSCQCFVREHCVFGVSCLSECLQMAAQAQLRLFFYRKGRKEFAKAAKLTMAVRLRARLRRCLWHHKLNYYPHSVRSEILVKATDTDALRLQRSRTLLSVFCQGTLCFLRFLA